MKKNRKIVNNIEFRQTTSCPRIWVSNDGHYIIPNSVKCDVIHEGTKLYNKNGYPLMMEVCSTKVDEEGKVVRVVKNIGRLVLEAWSDVEPTEEQKEVDHINRDPFDNRIENLRWCTRSENNKNRTLTHSVNPTWLNTPEVIAKRVATRKANKENKENK